MPNSARDLSEAEALYALIGDIYDCAVEPERWAPTIGRICTALDLVASQLYVFDRAQERNLFAVGWGEDPAMTRLIGEKYADAAAALQLVTLSRWSGDMDDPMVLSRDVPEEFAASRVTREWARPLGYCDGITLVVLQDGARVGFFSATRHDSVGLVTPREIRLMRLLAPHLRRAIAIGNLLDMRTLHATTLETALNAVAAGICIVDADGAVLHANAAAERMFAAGAPVRLRGGRIATAIPAASAPLRAAIAQAAAGEAALLRPGLGVPLGDPQEAPAIARVLPLSAGQARSRLVPRAAAAVFIAAGRDQPVPDLGAFAEQFALTPAERRVLGLLLAGATVADAAQTLGVTIPTMRSHLARLFGKTGTTRQSELLSLAWQLTPPTPTA